VIDGCKLPSNASKEWSGTHADLRHKKQKIDKAIRYILNKHKQSDAEDLDETLVLSEKKQVEKLHAACAKIKQFLKTNKDLMALGISLVKMAA
jgi:iron-sulfur cluster repair protein YtfE (RIC family)